MADMAKLVELVIRPDGTADFLVDGEEFPWDVNWNGLVVNGNGTVTLTLTAERTVVRLENPQPVAKSEETANTASEPWTVGWQFDPDKVEGVPDHVVAVRCLDDESEHPFLIRTNPETDFWAWASETHGGLLFRPSDGMSWNEWMRSFWNEKTFEVSALAE